MDAEPTDVRFQTPKDLAGPHYDDMMRSKENAVLYLSAPDDRVRLAAILICQSVWKCGSDAALVHACRQTAASDADDSIRLCAVDALGRALSASKSPDVSCFLADLVMDSANPIELRRDAYWALREVQFGLADTDFDTFLKRTICSIRPVLRANPGRFSEEESKARLTPQGRFPDSFWESAEDIDFDFVAQFASRR